MVSLISEDNLFHLVPAQEAAGAEGRSVGAHIGQGDKVSGDHFRQLDVLGEHVEPGTQGAGDVGAADITNVEVNCALKTFTIGGTLSGLAASSTLVLQNNAANNLSLTANGAFTFTTPIATGSTYAVTVLTAPATQQCTVTNGSGTVVDANITSVNVTCVNNSKITPSGTIGGTVRGLDVPGLVLVNSGGEKLTVDSNGRFEFATVLQRNTAYEVTVAGTPASPRHVCRVTNARGTVGSNARVTNVDVTCEADRFAYVAGEGPIARVDLNTGSQAIIFRDNPPGAIAITDRYLYFRTIDKVNGIRLDAQSSVADHTNDNDFVRSIVSTRGYQTPPRHTFDAAKQDINGAFGKDFFD